MILTLTPIVVIFLLIVFAFYASSVNERRRNQQLKWLVGFLRITRKIIQHVPQHRGMANAYLKGDVSFKDKLTQMQNTIDSDFAQFETIAQQPASILSLSDLNIVSNKWEEIKQKVFTLPPEESFTKHTVLISDLLNVIEESSELTSLLSGNEESTLIIHALIKEIPYLTETLGQSRGLGTGIAAQAECSVANRLKLGFLHQKGMKVLIDTVQPLMFSNHPKLESSGSALQDCLDKANHFLNCIDTELVNAVKIDIPSNEFYTTATEAIDSSFVLLDQLHDVLENIILKKR